MPSLTVFAAAVIVVVAGLFAWRWRDARRAHRVWGKLTRRARSSPARFDPALVENLPDPARRYFLFTIKPGAPLCTVTEIRTVGEIGLGTRQAPRYLPMRGHQILAPPHGLVWKLRAGRGMMRISGSDGFDGEHSWVRFWLFDTVPIVRAGGDRDHARAAFGRVVAEAVFWAPAAMLPQSGVAWEAVARDVARATVSHNGMTQTVDITVDDEGRPLTVIIPRWSNANPDKVYRIQPFGGYLSDFREFDGYVLPTRIEGGNFIATKDYFPFYKANVEAIRFITAC